MKWWKWWKEKERDECNHHWLTLHLLQEYLTYNPPPFCCNISHHLMRDDKELVWRRRRRRLAKRNEEEEEEVVWMIYALPFVVIVVVVLWCCQFVWCLSEVEGCCKGCARRAALFTLCLGVEVHHHHHQHFFFASLVPLLFFFLSCCEKPSLLSVSLFKPLFSHSSFFFFSSSTSSCLWINVAFIFATSLELLQACLFSFSTSWTHFLKSSKAIKVFSNLKKK